MSPRYANGSLLLARGEKKTTTGKLQAIENKFLHPEATLGLQTRGRLRVQVHHLQVIR